jgi:hypothetical protein
MIYELIRVAGGEWTPHCGWGNFPEAVVTPASRYRVFTRSNRALLLGKQPVCSDHDDHWIEKVNASTLLIARGILNAFLHTWREPNAEPLSLAAICAIYGLHPIKDLQEVRHGNL